MIRFCIDSSADTKGLQLTRKVNMCLIVLFALNILHSQETKNSRENQLKNIKLLLKDLLLTAVETDYQL